MAKAIPCKRYNAQITIRYGKPVTRTENGNTKEYLAHKILVDMVRLADDTWDIVNVSMVASLKNVHSDGYHKSMYVVDGFDMTPDIEQLIAHARELVITNCRGN